MIGNFTGIGCVVLICSLIIMAIIGFIDSTNNSIFQLASLIMGISFFILMIIGIIGVLQDTFNFTKNTTKTAINKVKNKIEENKQTTTDVTEEIVHDCCFENYEQINWILLNNKLINNTNESQDEIFAFTLFLTLKSCLIGKQRKGHKLSDINKLSEKAIPKIMNTYVELMLKEHKKSNININDAGYPNLMRNHLQKEYFINIHNISKTYIEAWDDSTTSWKENIEQICNMFLLLNDKPDSTLDDSVFLSFIENLFDRNCKIFQRI